jgi:acetolactate synthase I/II/III large subunit
MYKPVILIGNGCRNNPELIERLCYLNIPVLTTWQGIDLVAENNPAFCGRPGVFGQRAANIIQQMSTDLLCFGARLDGEQVAYDYDRFAPRAKILVYDVDTAELRKLPKRYECHELDLSDFDLVIEQPGAPEWLAWCKALYAHFRPELEGNVLGEYIDTFAFISQLSVAARGSDLLAIGSSSGAVNAFLQSFKVKAGQRVTVCATIGSMGADIPMALGGCIGSGRRTIVVTGDGGFQLNAQELETIRRLNLPITFFVFSNGGYNSIRVMQLRRFDGRLMGCNEQSGFTVPGLNNLAQAYDIPYQRFNFPLEIPAGPCIIEVISNPDWEQMPRVMASLVNGSFQTDDMENMSPKLDPQELEEIMRWGNDKLSANPTS